MELKSRRLQIELTDTVITEKRSMDFFSFQNLGANDVSLHFGDDPATLTNGLIIGQDVIYTVNNYGGGKISAITSTGVVQSIIVEG